MRFLVSDLLEEDAAIITRDQQVVVVLRPGVIVGPELERALNRLAIAQEVACEGWAP